ncbi:MAG: N-acetylneuraminate lyase [Eubacteriales bacterium]
MNKFEGVFTALLTPFDKNGKVNRRALEELIKFNLKQGVHGFYVCGSTAEVFMLYPEERREVYDIVRNCTDSDVTLIAHIGSINELEAIELGKYTSAIGYDAVSSVAPFYYKFSFEEIREYYNRVTDASGLKMLVYNFPAFSGVTLGVDRLSEFLRDDRFLGIKHTSSDFFALERCKSLFPEKIIYNGFDEMFLSGISMGADGGIGSTYNFMADKFVKIRDLFNSGDYAAAKEIQTEANRIISILSQLGVMQSEKEVLNQMGFDFGVCRHPFGELSDDQKALIRREITERL